MQLVKKYIQRPVEMKGEIESNFRLRETRPNSFLDVLCRAKFRRRKISIKHFLLSAIAAVVPCEARGVYAVYAANRVANSR